MKKGAVFVEVIPIMALLVFIVLAGLLLYAIAGGDKQIVLDSCGEGAQYCKTMPQLELMGKLKAPFEFEGQQLNLADLMVLRVKSPDKISEAQLRGYAGQVLAQGECLHIIKQQDGQAEEERIYGNCIIDNEIGSGLYEGSSAGTGEGYVGADRRMSTVSMISQEGNTIIYAKLVQALNTRELSRYYDFVSSIAGGQNI